MLIQITVTKKCSQKSHNVFITMKCKPSNYICVIGIDVLTAIDNYSDELDVSFYKNSS